MSNKMIKPLTLAIGTGIVGAFSLAQIAQANPTFHLNSLVAGYTQSAVGNEGKCGEGKCGADKKGKEGSCGADKKGKEGSCGGDKH